MERWEGEEGGVKDERREIVDDGTGLDEVGERGAPVRKVTGLLHLWGNTKRV